MSSSTKIDNRKKYILILGKGPTQGLKHTLSAERMYSINFTEHNKKFCLSLRYNGANSYMFFNGKETHKFKAKDSEIVATPSCLGSISKDWTVDNMKQTGLNGYIYDFSVDYGDTAVDDIRHSQIFNEKLLHSIIKCLGLLKGVFLTGLTFLSTLTSVNSLSFTSMNNQECKVRLQIVNVNSEVNAVVVGAISIIHMQNCVFLMLLTI